MVNNVSCSVGVYYLNGLNREKNTDVNSRKWFLLFVNYDRNFRLIPFVKLIRKILISINKS